MTNTKKTTATTRAKPASRKGVATKTKPVESTTAEVAVAAKTPSKIDGVVTLLRREEGATIADLMAATSWQAHSVRGAISGALKKKLGLTVTSEKAEGVRRYRIVEAQA